MRYIVSVNNSTSQAQIVQWVSAGVEEFYFGYMPDQWVRKYGWEICANRRPYPGAPHLTDIGHLREVIRWIHQSKAKAILAINQHTYPLVLAKEIVKMALLMQQEGADALLIADPAVLMMLRAAKVRLPVHASVGLGVQNVEAVEFFRNLGIYRFVLPRKIHPDEIVSLLSRTPKKVEYEVFLLGEWCYFNDQTCFCSHGHGKQDFCYRKKYQGDQPPRSIPRNNYVSCGLCLAYVLSDYYDRILFKIPGRTTVLKASTVMALKMLGEGTMSRAECIKMMKCQRRFCAYELA